MVSPCEPSVPPWAPHMRCPGFCTGQASLEYTPDTWIPACETLGPAETPSMDLGACVGDQIGEVRAAGPTFCEHWSWYRLGFNSFPTLFRSMACGHQVASERPEQVYPSEQSWNLCVPFRVARKHAPVGVSPARTYNLTHLLSQTLSSVWFPNTSRLLGDLQPPPSLLATKSGLRLATQLCTFSNWFCLPTRCQDHRGRNTDTKWHPLPTPSSALESVLPAGPCHHLPPCQRHWGLEQRTENKHENKGIPFSRSHFLHLLNTSRPGAVFEPRPGDTSSGVLCVLQSTGWHLQSPQKAAPCTASRNSSYIQWRGKAEDAYSHHAQNQNRV